MGWYRIDVPGTGNVYAQADSPAAAQAVGQQIARSLKLGATDASSIKVVGSSGPMDGGQVWDQGRLISFAQYASGGPNQGQTGPGGVGTGDQNESTGGSGGGGSGGGSMPPDPGNPNTTAFWRIRVGELGDVFFKGTKNDALAAASAYASKNGIEDTALVAVETSENNYNSGTKVLPGGGSIRVTGPSSGSGSGENQPPSGGVDRGGSAEEPPVPAPPVDGVNVAPDNPSPIGLTGEDVSPLAVFRKYLSSYSGGNLNPNNPIGQIAQERIFPSTHATFALDQLVRLAGRELPVGENGQQLTGAESILGNPDIGVSPQDFYSFLQGRTGPGQDVTLDPGAVRAPGLALRDLELIAGMSGYGDDLIGSVLQGATPGSDIGGVIDNATLGALRSILAPSVANLFGSALLRQAHLGFADKLASAVDEQHGDPTYVRYLLQNVLGR